jgi:hypothetical protein
MIVDINKFFSVQKDMDYIPSTQSQGWHNYQLYIKKSNCYYFIDNDYSPNICAWGLIRSFPFIGKILQINGESYKKEISRAQIKAFYNEIAVYSEKHFIFILVSSQALYSIDYEMAIRQAGFIRPLVLLVCPLSIIVDLNNMQPSKTWGTRLKEARKNNLRFEHILKPDTTHINHIVRMYSELSQQKKLGYSLNADALSVLLESDAFNLFFVYSHDGDPISARIIYVNKDFGCGIITANSKKSRNIRGTSYFILDSVLNWLRDNGIKNFDMGRIGPGKRSSNSVYEFKSYIGSPEISYNGEWIYSNNKFIETAFYAFMNLKMSRY